MKTLVDTMRRSVDYAFNGDIFKSIKVIARMQDSLTIGQFFMTFNLSSLSGFVP